MWPARRYGLRMARSYLRFPHLRGDTLVFVAEDDVWTAPVSGGRAYRLTADDVPVAHAAALPGRHAGGVDVVAGRRAGGVRRRRGRRVRAAADVVGRPRAAVGWTPSGEVLALTAAGQPSGRRTWAWDVPADGGAPPASRARAGVGPGAVRRLARRCCWPRPGRSSRRGGSATAAGRPAKLWWDADGSGGVRPARSPRSTPSSRRRCRSGRARIAFLSDHEGWGNLYSLDRRRQRPAPAHRPRRPRRARVLRAAREHRRHAGRLRVGGRAVDPRLAGPDAERRAGSTSGSAARAPPGSRTASRPSAWLSGAVPGPDRPHEHRAGPRHRAPAHPPRRPGPHPARRAGRPGPAGRAAGRRPGGVGRRRRRRGRGVRRAARPAGRRRAAAAPVRRRASWAGCCELAAAPDGVGGRADRARRAAAGARPPATTARLRELARGADGEISGLCWSPDSAWLAYGDPVEAGLSRIVMARLADDTLVAVTEPRFVDTDPDLHHGRHATWPSCPGAASTRSTTSTRST